MQKGNMQKNQTLLIYKQSEFSITTFTSCFSCTFKTWLFCKLLNKKLRSIFTSTWVQKSQGLLRLLKYLHQVVVTTVERKKNS